MATARATKPAAATSLAAEALAVAVSIALRRVHMRPSSRARAIAGNEFSRYKYSRNGKHRPDRARDLQGRRRAGRHHEGGGAAPPRPVERHDAGEAAGGAARHQAVPPPERSA